MQIDLIKIVILQIKFINGQVLEFLLKIFLFTIKLENYF